MRTARHPLLVAPLIALALVSCGGSESTSTRPDTEAPTSTDVDITEPPATDAPVTEPPATEPPATDAPVTEPPATDAPVTEPPATEQPAGETVTLLDAGAEPRQEMRLDIEPGVASMTVIQSQDITQTFGGMSQPGISSATEMVMSNEVSRTDGGYQVIGTVTEAGAAEGSDPQVAAQLDAALAGFVGVRTIAIIDDRGVMIESRIDEESVGGVAPAIATMMTQLTESSELAAPLPSEPIGLGARWSVEQRVTASGLDISQLVEYRLVAIEGTTLTLEVRGSQRPLDTTVQMPGVPGDVEITTWTIATTGTVVLDLTTVVPTSRIEASGEQAFSVQGDELVQQLRSTTEVSPTPSG